MFSFTSLQRRCFEILLVGILVLDLLWQTRFLRGPLLSPSAIPDWALGMALLAGIASFACKPTRRLGIAFIALLHYLVTTPPTSEADAWIWLMAIALVCIPDEGDRTESYWVGVLKLTGFLVYFYAGLNKVIHRDWWTGQALSTVLQIPFLTKEPFSALAQWPRVCGVLSRLTLIQRLIVPWGLWSRRLWVRRTSASLLVGMHLSYLLMLNVGIFSWVGTLYLMPFFFPCPKEESAYYQLPKGTGRLSLSGAVAFALYLVILPAWAVGVGFGLSGARLLEALTPPGFILRWTMFADPVTHSSFSVYKIKTCDGEEISDDRVYWPFGSSSDYFRRRLWTRLLTVQLGDHAIRYGPNALGPMERRLIESFPKPIAGRQWQLFSVSPEGSRLLLDSGYSKVSECDPVRPGRTRTHS